MTTDDLLDKLRGSRTDLARLVAHVCRRRPSYLVISVEAVNAWKHRDPHSWAEVCTWLSTRGVAVRLI